MARLPRARRFCAPWRNQLAAGRMRKAQALFGRQAEISFGVSITTLDGLPACRGLSSAPIGRASRATILSGILCLERVRHAARRDSGRSAPHRCPNTASCLRNARPALDRYLHQASSALYLDRKP